jgi:hypothetical protein
LGIVVDRIVDGILTPAELRAAIERLDHDPEGWKRCALAFLEAQCWREAFLARDVPAGDRLEPRVSGLPRPTARTAQTGWRWVRLAMAACLLGVAFSLGWLSRAARPGSESGPSPPSPLSLQPIIAESGDANPPPGTPGADDPSRSTLVDAQQAGDGPLPPYLNPVVVALARLRIGSEGESAEVPVLAGPGITEDWLAEQPPPVSEYGQALWQSRGFQVDQRRQLITATLADGRFVTVPVDQVELRYTGNNPL